MYYVDIKVFTDQETFHLMGKSMLVFIEMLVAYYSSYVLGDINLSISEIFLLAAHLFAHTVNFAGKEHALVICNHKSDIDWLVGWVLAQRAGCLGSTLAVMKKSSKFLPSGLQRLKDFPRPFWLALFVEGTRFTQAKLLAAQEYAASQGLPIPRNVLIPRTKGFVSAVSNMRSFVPAIYDITLAIPKSSPPPTMLNLFQGKSSVVHIHIKRHLMKELPETYDGVAQWCKDIFVAKDALLDKHMAEDTFSDKELQDMGRPKKSLVVVVSWACLLIFGALKFLQRSLLLSSQKGIALTASGLAIVTFLMHILIRSSQSEHSTPAKVAPSKPKDEEKPSETRDDKHH
ncbi:unnamed protein product [Dovyalis caffra]|uniref:1-acylglycerol-3-phosphate O-acyltransferase n=1 Tax=Dovyalis caffra TaxID=77055 RepID=A0AAV1S1J7_9ROSI|nr:unnamed protein product [Dovyalis caffra]